MHDNIESLIAQMTLEEKIALLAGADMWHTVSIQRLGIPSVKTTDGPIGARGEDAPDGPTSACFPCGTALAATWNPALVERVGQALGEETRSKGAHILLAPTVNVHRSPLAGRNFECYSEDPYLTSQMAIAYIKGVQSRGVGACIKHFVCNDSEFERRSMSSEVGERTLREMYLRPFEIALREAKPWAVMSSYNRVNGTYVSENSYILLDILKGEWGFDGIVMSDWWGTYSPNVLKGGLDLEMPGPARWMGEPALEAVRCGAVSESVVDDKVRRLLQTVSKAGLFEHPEPHPEQAVDRPEHREIAREAAAEAIVLLKNEQVLKNEQGILPLGPSVKSIAVIGENAKWASIMGGGSVRVSPHYVVSPLEAIQERAGKSQIRYAIGCAIHQTPPQFDKGWLTGDLTVHYFANRDLAGDPVHTQTTTKTELIWVGHRLPYVDLANFSVRVDGAFTVPENNLYTLNLSSIGRSRLYVDDQLVVDLWQAPSQEGRSQSANIQLFAGRSYRLRVEYASEPGPFWRKLRLGCIPKVPDDAIEQAVELAAKSDVAVVFAGLTYEWESEGFDRPDMSLPGDQVKLIERVVAANPRTIVVLNTGAPVDMDWIDRVPAVVQAWYLGQESGHAIADVLFGDVNPCGKLPTTWPKRLQDNPAFLNYPGENGKVLYGEGIFVGYRYYDKKGVEPRFPFGYGLSYTTFAYRDLTVMEGEDGQIRVSMQVENTGRRAGKEIVQVYVRDVQSRLVRPEKELKAFAKVALEPGEIRTLAFTLDDQALAYYDPALRCWVAEAGEYQVLVGSSSRDIRLTASLDWKGKSSQ
jgi:beta-glucosidase